MWPAPRASAYGLCNCRFAASATRRQWRTCEGYGSRGRGARCRTPDETAVRSARSPPRKASARSANSRPTTKPGSTSRLPKRSAAAPSDVGLLDNCDVPGAICNVRLTSTPAMCAIGHDAFTQTTVHFSAVTNRSNRHFAGRSPEAGAGDRRAAAGSQSVPPDRTSVGVEL